MVVIGVIPLEQDKVHVSPWIIFACSLVFAATGMVAFLYPLRDKYPAACRFAEAMLLSGFLGAGMLVAWHSQDIHLSHLH